MTPGRVPEHRPGAEAERLAQLLEIGDQQLDGQRRGGRQRIGPQRAALVDADDPQPPGQRVADRPHEVVAPLARPAVDEQQWWGVRIPPIVDE